MGDCPICKRQICGHFAFGEDLRGYIGAEFVLWAFGIHIEKDPPQDTRSFLDMDKDIVRILQKHFKIVDGKGYAKSPKTAVPHAKAEVAKYLRSRGYALPEN